LLVSGVLQLTKTGSPIMKNFSLLRLLPSDAMMARKFYTPYDVNCTYLHILTACGMSHILTQIGHLEAAGKTCMRLPEAQTRKLRLRGS